MGLKLSGDAFQFWTSAPFETLEDFKSAFLLRFAITTKYRELKYGKFELKPNQSVVEYASLVKQAWEEKFGNNVNPSIIIHDLVNGLPDTYAKLLLEKKPTTYASALATLSHAEDVQTALRLRKSGGGLEAVNAVGSTNYRGRGNFNRRGNFRLGYEARQLPKSVYSYGSKPRKDPRCRETGFPFKFSGTSFRSRTIFLVPEIYSLFFRINFTAY